MTNNFFINVAKTKSIQDMFKIYKSLYLRSYAKNQRICEYGA